jgi:ribosomal-protein-alanine N-acetyltransferase
MKSLPTIRTERLILRPFSLADTARLHLLWTDKEMRKFLYDGLEITLEQAAETVQEIVLLAEEKGIGMWCLFAAEAETELVGFCGLRYIGKSTEVELLYGLLPAYWKRGFATEASRAAVTYLFRNYDVQRVFAGSDPLNTASFGVTKRLGMQQVPDGTVPVPGAIYYCLDRSEFEKASNER